MVFKAALIFGLTLVSHANAETFFIKTKDNTAKAVRFGLETSLSEVRVDLSKDLKAFLQHPEQVPTNWVRASEPTEAEKLIDASFMILTGLMVISTHDSYELGPELRLSSFFGLMFFVFPFENHYLYRRCKGDDQLIAVSENPNPETLRRIKSLEEIEKSCKPRESKSENNS